jgi:hypothetical protein
MAGGKKFILGLCAGLIAASLGVLWSLQGAGAVHVRPIVCVANCKPITGGSVPWLSLGVTFMLLGIAVIGASVAWRIHTNRTDTVERGSQGAYPARGRRSRAATDPERPSGLDARDREITSRW